MTKLTEADCLAWKTYAPQLRTPTLFPWGTVGFKYIEISQQGESWLAVERDIEGRPLRARLATTEAEVRDPLNQDTWHTVLTRETA